MKISSYLKPTHFNNKNIYGALFAGVFALTTHSVFANVSFNQISDPAHLVQIIEHGNLLQIKQLVAEGLDINKDLGNDGTPLIVAVQSGNKSTVEYLVKQGADINLESENDGNPLVAAALNNHLGLVKYLHKKGAVIDAVTRYDETALISASRAGHFEVVKYLVENGADVNLAVKANVLKGVELRSPLNGAKTQRIRRFLIEHGAQS